MAVSARATERTALRFRPAWALLIGLLLALLPAAPLHAQDFELGDLPPAEPESEPDEDGAAPVIREIVDDGDRSVQIVEVDESGFPIVDVVVAVPPVLAGDLAASSFAMTEDGSLREITVAKLRDVLEVVVVIDTSGSMDGDPIDSAKVAAKNFVNQLDDETRVAVVGFGATASTKATFESSRSEVAAAIDGLRAGGETALYDGLALAASEFSETGARRFVVVLSDGKDTVSATSPTEVANDLTASAVSLYAITLVSADADFSGLRALAADVDGQVVAASDAASLRSTYASVASRLTNQYQISYRSSAAGPVDIIISVDSQEVLAIAKGTIDPADTTGTGQTTSGGVEPETGTSNPSAARAQIDTSNPLISVSPTDDSLLGSDNARYAGLGALFLGLMVALFIAFSTEPQGPSAFERLNFKPGKGMTPRSGLASIADRATGMADRLLEKQQKRGALDSVLERAGMEMRPGEYIMAAVGVTIGLGAFGFVMHSPIGGLVMLGVGAFGGKFYVNYRAGKRQRAFGNQLGDTLIMIAGSLRAGHGVVEAIDTVASQAASPTGDEFTRAVAEARIGRDMVESLYDIAERTASEDFIWVVRAISINRELGGDLAEILDNVGETIRDRNRLRDQVKALSAEGKVSGIILFGLPILVAIWVQVSNPEYMNAMTSQTAGKVVFGLAVFALVCGGVWLKKLVKVEF